MSGGIDYTERERLLEGIKVRIEQNVNAAYGRGFRAGKESMKLALELKERARKQEYERGFSDGEKSMAEKVNSEYRIDVETEIAERLRDEYERGRSDGRQEAWGAAKKISLESDDGGISDIDLLSMFDGRRSYRIMREVPVDEVISKIAAYEKQKDEIKVGDEVQITDDDNELAVLTHCDVDQSGTLYTLITKTGEWRTRMNNIRKTGRHFPQIVEVMKQMNEEEDD